MNPWREAGEVTWFSPHYSGSGTCHFWIAFERSSSPDRSSRAGLPLRLSLHDLRHTHATVLIGNDIHPKKVQEFLGHTNIEIVLDTYSQVLPTMRSGHEHGGCAVAISCSEALWLPNGSNSFFSWTAGYSEARPAGFEPATGGLEVRNGRVSPDAAKCRKGA
jgi:hypothetical protein